MIVDASPDGLWNIAQTLLIFLFLAVGAFFLFKYFRGKETELKSANQINIGYGFFFIATGLNQLVYAITSVLGFLVRCWFILRPNHYPLIFNLNL